MGKITSRMGKIIDINARAARQKIRVAVCVPCASQVATQFMYDLTRMMTATAAQRQDIELRLIVHQGSILLNQRNDLVKRALEFEATHILWLDSDMRFPKDLLVRLLERNEPVVAANYVTRQHPLRPIAVALEAGQRQPLYTTPADTGLVEVEHTGLGVMLVDADVFRQLAQPWFNFWYNEKAEGFVGEDAYFCFCAREAGLKVYVDQDVSQHVKHVGEIEYDHSDAVDVREKILQVAMAEVAAE